MFMKIYAIFYLVLLILGISSQGMMLTLAITQIQKKQIIAQIIGTFLVIPIYICAFQYIFGG